VRGLFLVPLNLRESRMPEAQVAGMSYAGGSLSENTRSRLLDE
jgi:hypothetical protein